MSFSDLIRKYDVPAPRYTSYPTVPYWSASPTPDEWCDSLKRAFAQQNARLSMYLHLPFCETLCVYCGCNNVITKDHSREQDYIALLKTEIGLYRDRVFSETPAGLYQLHLGGGTPTFFSPANLRDIIETIYRITPPLVDGFQGSVEVDPRRCTVHHLEAFKDLGFNRISLGVQDFTEPVQRIINRMQPFEITRRVTVEARRLGFESVNFDLIYGLPLQTEDSIRLTIEKTLALRPDRIAFYSMAVVPWIKPAHKHIIDRAPRGEEKRKLYEIGRRMLLDAGYVEIGMDHFALPHDALTRSFAEGRLHRNFMGYVEERTPVLLGLGISSIGETPEMFHQNEKTLEKYRSVIEQNRLPTMRGHKLTKEDRMRREQILSIMTRSETALTTDDFDEVRRKTLQMLEADGIIQLNGTNLRVTQLGRAFLRNICMVFDDRLRAKEPEARVFSQAI